MDPNGDGIVDEAEKLAFARSTAELRASHSKYKKGLGATLALLTLAWIGNAVLMMVIVNLSKDLKVEGVSLKTMNGGPVSTHGQKNVFEVTVTVAGRRLDEHEQRSSYIPGHSSAASVCRCQITCANVLLAVSSIENGDDESLVKITMGEGFFWEPRMSAASFHLHENSFGIDELYLQDRRAVLYDVNCEMSKEACETNPSTPCDVLPSAATAPRALSSFEDAFDGDVRRRLTHAGVEHKTAEECAERGCFDHCPQPEPCVRRSVTCECSTPYPNSCFVSHATNVELCQGTYSGPSEGGFNANLNRFG